MTTTDDDATRLRASEPSETPALLALAEGTGVFKPLEIQTLEQLLLDYYALEHANAHRCVTAWQGAAPVGFAYWGPVPMTDGTWYLYWIVVRRDLQSRGWGTRLLARCESDVRAAGGRVLLIDTSSLAGYAPTRNFYAKHGYEPPTRIRDFYADGDDLLVFRKRLR